MPIPGLVHSDPGIASSNLRTLHRETELRDISKFRAGYPVRTWVVEKTDYTVRDVNLGGLDFVEIVGANVLLYDKAVKDPNIIAPLNRFLTGSLDVYRGIAIWHRFFKAAEMGTISPMGAGPPDFTTANSAYVPFADARGEARVAAISRRGGSNPGQNASWEDVPRFNEDDPEQKVGLIAKVSVSRAAGDAIAFFNAGELQVRGPVRCTTDTLFLMKDIRPGVFHEMQLKGTRGGPKLDDGIHDADL